MTYKRNSLVWKLIIPVPLVLAAGMLAAWIVIPHYIASDARQNAVESAVQTVNQFKLLRAYYTDNVVRKVLLTENLSPSIDHSADDNIPLPATMIHDMSEVMADQDLTIHL